MCQLLVLSPIEETCLDVTRSAIEIHVQVLDRAKFTEHVLNIFLGRLFMHICNNNDPPLD